LRPSFAPRSSAAAAAALLDATQKPHPPSRLPRKPQELNSNVLLFGTIVIACRLSTYILDLYTKLE
jgi:hypothetical protein